MRKMYAITFNFFYTFCAIILFIYLFFLITTISKPFFSLRSPSSFMFA
ncbi:hypothetical protein POPTR_T013401v4 [Populus trichocarpa]|uniref:Uncharacterized protein n=1 Tax=Populus trichocarpa TaxID=3694 RepID=A0ACC0RIR1_POPTR|nr:hypothetical protein POPTR_T013401v4 [Populus trichocarpa]